MQFLNVAESEEANALLLRVSVALKNSWETKGWTEEKKPALSTPGIKKITSWAFEQYEIGWKSIIALEVLLFALGLSL